MSQNFEQPNLVLVVAPDAHFSIPKGLCPPAQGCEQRATLGNTRPALPNSKGVVPFENAMPDRCLNQGMEFPAASPGARRLRRFGVVIEGIVDFTPVVALTLKRRKRRAPILAIFATLLSLTAVAQPTTNSPAPNDISAFNLITERNIFNTRRSARYVPSARRDTGRPNRSEAFALVGTLAYEKGPFAFFDGNRSDYKEVAKQGDSIAGFKVVEISPSRVKLASPTNEVELALGMQLHREDQGPWQVSVRPESAEPSVAPSTSSHLTFQTNSASSNTSAISELLNGLANGEIPNFIPPGADSSFAGQLPGGSAPSTNSAPTLPAGGNEVLLRLMEQRRLQELNQ
jgi:hypothetical protein